MIFPLNLQTYKDNPFKLFPTMLLFFHSQNIVLKSRSIFGL
jgi:hypothetical protein